MQYTNGVQLIRCLKTHKVLPKPVEGQTGLPIPVDYKTQWNVVYWVNGVATVSYHTQCIDLRPMKIILSDDKSYWIADAMPYDYSPQVFPRYIFQTLYIGYPSRVNDQVNNEHLAECIKDEVKEKKKTTRKRTVVCNKDK